MTVVADSPVFVAFIKRIDDKFYSQKDSLKCLNCDKTGKLGTNQDRLKRCYYHCTNCHKTIHRADMARRLGILVPPELVTSTRKKYIAAGAKGNNTSEQPSAQQPLLRHSDASTSALQPLSSRGSAFQRFLLSRKTARLSGRESSESIEVERIHGTCGDETAQPMVSTSSHPSRPVDELIKEIRAQVVSLAFRVEELETRLQDQVHRHTSELGERNLQHKKELEARDLLHAKELKEQEIRVLKQFEEKFLEIEKELEERCLGGGLRSFFPTINANLRSKS
ncbi:uncharacterized protein VTP21DRAFT_9648 [Calcarisporiella thermophila]|uniref:uncharacterized protein n=1 Tax=Calcarisporiella thermophila TaxID=911321 RepID=UPI0037435D75